MKKTITLIYLLISLSLFSQNTRLSQMWTGLGGEMQQFLPSSAASDDLGNTYLVSSTFNQSTLHDILIKKFNRKGDLIWENSFNGAANLEDYGAAIFVDDTYNVFITGASINSISNALDLVVVKYNSNGVQQWSTYYNNAATPNPDDGGTSIVGDNQGSIYVCGSSQDTSDGLDFVTLNLNDTSGSISWTTRYDHISLNEIPTKIDLVSGKVVVSGGSQITLTPEKWELATVTYNSSSGTQLDLKRTNGSSISGVDEIFDFEIDGLGNIYLVGSVVNSVTGKDLSVYKLDDDLNLIWEQHFDKDSLPDGGHAIELDSQDNIILGGYCTQQGGSEDYYILKLNAAGNIIWEKIIDGKEHVDDRVYALTVKSDSIIFASGEMFNTENSDIVTFGLNGSNGEFVCKATFDGGFNLNDKPLGISDISENEFLVIANNTQPGGSEKSQTIKYGIFQRPSEFELTGNQESHVKSELIIRFKQSALNMSSIDDAEFTAGPLEDFLTSQALDTMNSRVGFNCDQLTAFKVHPNLTSSQTHLIDQSGDSIPMPKFWTSLSVFFPKNEKLEDLIDTLQSAYSILDYVHINPAIRLNTAPNDPLYNSQPGLFNPTSGINVESAWDNGYFGADYVEVVIFDTGINWRHEDFGGPSWDESKAGFGIDYVNGGVSPENVDNPDITGHGTAIAGIIGALRDNEKGIAGIAGGEGDDTDDYNFTGCPVYNYRVFSSESEPIGNTANFLQGLVSASVDLFDDITGNQADVYNLSFSLSEDVQSVQDVLRTVARSGAAIVGPSGNDGLEVAEFPASYEDYIILKTGGSNASGNLYTFSNIGFDIDFIAPAINTLYDFLDPADNEGYLSGDNGTSFSVAHVSGVSALLMSEHNVSNPESSYPNNLSGEDVEQILQKSATNGTLTEPDNETGFGLIDAANALDIVSLPTNYIAHVGGLITGTTTTDGPQVPYLIEGIPLNGVNPGVYLGFRREFTTSFTYTLNAGESVIDHWPRFAQSDGYTEDLNIFEDPETEFTYTFSESGDVVTVTTTTYAFFLELDDDMNQINTWIPRDPSQMRTNVSLHVQTGAMNTTNSLVKNSFLGFPNPANEIVNLKFSNSRAVSSDILIFDIQGREVFSKRLGILASGTHQTAVDISDLKDGVYICVLDQEGEKSIFKLSLY